MPKTYRNLSDLERAQIQAHLELGCKVWGIAYALRTFELVSVGHTPLPLIYAAFNSCDVGFPQFPGHIR